MNCPYCGFELLEGATFCTRCGAVMPDQTGRSSYGYTGYSGGLSDTGEFDTGRLSVVRELGESADPGTPAPPPAADVPYAGTAPRAASGPYDSGTYRPAPRPVPQRSGGYRTVPRQTPAESPAPRPAPRAVPQASGGYPPVPNAPRREIAPRTGVYGAPPAGAASMDDAECFSIRQYSGNPQFRPLSAWKYFGLSLLYAIPLVGLIFLIIHSFSRRNLVRRSFARSYFCRMLVGGCILAALFAVLLFTGMFKEDKLPALWKSLQDAFGQISLPQ